MPSVISCIACHGLLILKAPKPTLDKAWEVDAQCQNCRTSYSIVVRITQPSPLHPEKVEEIKVRPSA